MSVCVYMCVYVYAVSAVYMVMLMAACHEAEANQSCSLDLRVYEDDFVHAGNIFYQNSFLICQL